MAAETHRSILLVDDSATSRILVKLYLTGLEYVFLEAARGEDALALLETTQVGLLIVDVNMPGMDGLTFVQKVRSSPDATVRNLPVILLTGDKSEETRVRGRAAGANEFVTKPVTTVELRGAVQRLLGP